MKNNLCLSLIFSIFVSGCSTPVLHGIGVYEGSYPNGNRHSFGYHPNGRLDIKIHTKNQPVILVLSSYEPVVWNVIPDNEVEIEEIILSSYHPSKVSGVTSEVKITRKPFGYSYKLNEKNSRFSVKVFKYTGISRFESFQGSYKAELFSIH